MAMKTFDFNQAWRFRNEWSDEMIEETLDDSAWTPCELPHDWSIAGEFSEHAPSYCRGGWLPTGKGCYRKKFSVPKEFAHERAVFRFGGVFRNATIYLNGTKIAEQAWGYLPFEAECGDVIRRGADEENLLCVTVDNAEPMGCRWYAGSGIYRPVELVFYSPEIEFIHPGGIRVIPGAIPPERTPVSIEFQLRNLTKERLLCSVRHEVFAKDAPGVCLAECEHTHRVGASLSCALNDLLELDAPQLWSVETPHLYRLRSTIVLNGKCADTVETIFGIRTAECHPEHGFLLNGTPLKLRGVCLHNDGGALGAACDKNTFLRQLAILKTMGCNSVRTAHHPFSEEFLDACDESGILVLAECFDEWDEPIRVAPCADGEFQSMYAHYYAHLFNEHAKRDLSAMILRDRNHPSIFLWSIGNEVPQMYKFSGAWIAGILRETVKNLDPTRPVTCAVVTNRVEHANIACLDVGGYNYPSPGQMDEFHTVHPHHPFLITEHYSAQRRRPPGAFDTLARLRLLSDSHPAKFNFICEHEDLRPGTVAWEAIEARKFVMGGFIWTGWDYLGEPTPYDFPAHSSFFGVIDTCGFPKEGYYFYKSVWRPEKLVHIAALWDYEPGEPVLVRVISNCDEVELFLNGTSLGTKRGNEDFLWHVPFEKGELHAIGIDNGRVVAEDRLHTSGEAAKIHLALSAYSPLKPGMLHVEATIQDITGRRIRNAETIIEFVLEGPGTIAGLDNGDPLSLEPFGNTNKRSCRSGRCLCIVKATKAGSVLMLSARAAGLPAASLRIELP